MRGGNHSSKKRGWRMSCLLRETMTAEEGEVSREGNTEEGGRGGGGTSTRADFFMMRKGRESQRSAVGGRELKWQRINKTEGVCGT